MCQKILLILLSLVPSQISCELWKDSVIRMGPDIGMASGTLSSNIFHPIHKRFPGETFHPRIGGAFRRCVYDERGHKHCEFSLP